MKIPLFYKSSTIRTAFALVLSICIVGLPDYAQASFFSGIVSKVLGTPALAAQVTPPPTTTNSQTVPLLQSSINPDLKNMTDDRAVPVTIVADALSTDSSLVGTDSIDKEYASSAEITTYTVQKGDTIGKVANKFGISKNTIIQSNDFLNSKGTLTVGQVLTILPVNGVAYTVKKGDTVTAIANKYNVSSDDILSYNNFTSASDIKAGDTVTIPGATAPIIAAKTPDTTVIASKTPVKPVQKPVNTTPVVQKAVQVQTPVVAVQTQVQASLPSSGGEGGDMTEAPAGQSQNPSTATPASSGFIWPIPLGVGRISQGLHDDNAMDLAAPKGTPIYAPKDGTILLAHPTGYNGGYGLYVVINFNDGGQMLFGHMSKVAAVAGDSVKQGDIIGYVGTTGSSTGNHVHLSARGIKNPYSILRVGDTSDDFK